MPILGGYLGGRHIDAAVAGQASRQGGLARMAEGGMPRVAGRRDGLRQVLVEPERAGYGARYLRNLKGMGKPRAEMIAFGGQEHLGFVRQAAETLAMQDLVAITLEFGSQEIRLARTRAALGFVGLSRIRAQERMLAQLLVLAVNDVHGYPPDLRFQACRQYTASGGRAAQGGKLGGARASYLNYGKVDADMETNKPQTGRKSIMIHPSAAICDMKGRHERYLDRIPQTREVSSGFNVFRGVSAWPGA